MHPEPPSSVPNLPSVESMLDRPLKPTDLISETSTVQLDQIGAAPSEVDELHSHQQQRKRSIPCAFVSLDHSVAIIQDNLRIQSEGKQSTLGEANTIISNTMKVVVSREGSNWFQWLLQFLQSCWLNSRCFP